MPSHARKHIVRFGEIGIYHVWSRCVQRAFLCGADPLSGVDYDHRRAWIEGLVAYQASVFAIDVGTYSVLHNHFHLICRTRPDLVSAWSDEEVAWRWRSAWPCLDDGVWRRAPSDEDIETLLGDAQRIAAIRHKLSSLSWFLARIKEPIARLANGETGRSGCFWESRFGSRELDTEDAVLCCTLYVDLNQVKAGMASSLEASHCSAIQKRLLGEQQRAEWIASQADLSHGKFHGDFHAETPVKDFEFTADQVATMFADCWLAPITDAGPLATTEAPVIDTDHGHPSSTIAEETDSQDRSPATESTDAASAKRATSVPRSPSGVKSRTRRRHRRLAKRRRRASNRTMLSLPLTQYLALARRMAQDVMRDWKIVPAHDDLRDASPSNWRGSVSLFVDWARASLESAIDISAEIRRILGYPARGDPPTPLVTN